MAEFDAPLSIRAARLGDLDEILALETASFATDRLSRRALRAHILRGHRPVLVARFGASLAGYALVALRERARVARLYSIAVDPAAARRGVARALLGAAESYARARRRDALRLEVRADNARAIALYERLGYARFGRAPGYYADGEDALRFEKRLRPP